MSSTPEILKSRRQSLRLSQDQLAGAAGLTRKTVMRAEAGSRISSETLKALCAVLDLDSTQLSHENPMPASAPGAMSEESPEDGGGPGLMDIADDAGLPEDTRALLLRLAGCIGEIVPNARALAVTDAASWRRAQYRIHLDVEDPEEADPDRGLAHSRVLFAASAACLMAFFGASAGVLILLFLTLVGVTWAGHLTQAIVEALPSPSDHAKVAIVQAAYMMVPLLGGFIGYGYFSQAADHLGRERRSRLRLAGIIDGCTLDYRRRVYVAGTNGLHILEVGDGGQVTSVHIEPWMVETCMISGDSEQPTLSLAKTLGDKSFVSLGGSLWLSRAYHPEAEFFELPNLINGPSFIEAMAGFRPRVKRHPNKAVTHTLDIGPVPTTVAA